MEKFGDLFSKSWGEYKEGFWTFFRILLIFSIVPGILMGLASLYYTEFFEGNVGMAVSLIILGVIVFLVDLIAAVSLIFYSINHKKRMSPSQAIEGGRRYYWRYVGLVLLFTVIFGAIIAIFALFGWLVFPNPIGFLILWILALFTLIFIIYWMIRWSFSYWFLIAEDKSINESLRNSSKLVKNNWWNIFGYFLLFGLIAVGIAILVSLPIGILRLTLVSPVDLSTSVNAGELVVSFETQRIMFVFSSISDALTSIIITPLWILFSKNLYFSIRKPTKEKAKKKVSKVKSK